MLSFLYNLVVAALSLAAVVLAGLWLVRKLCFPKRSHDGVCTMAFFHPFR